MARVWFDESHSHAEDRHLILGHSGRERLMIVSCTMRGRDVIRIVGARLATPRERRDYEEDQGRGR